MISDRVVERLIVYRRLLKKWAAERRDRIFSHELAALAGVTAAQVRRDIMTVRYVGSPAKGYEVKSLVAKITELLDTPGGQSVALVGIGHLGQALMAYFSGRWQHLSISVAFDTVPEKISRVLHGCHCYPMTSLENVIRDQNIRIAVLAVPGEFAQDTAHRLVDAGVVGILNFTPEYLDVPHHVFVEDIDIAISLEKVAYFARPDRDTKE